MCILDTHQVLIVAALGPTTPCSQLILYRIERSVKLTSVLASFCSALRLNWTDGCVRLPTKMAAVVQTHQD